MNIYYIYIYDYYFFFIQHIELEKDYRQKNFMDMFYFLITQKQICIRLSITSNSELPKL